MIRINNIFLVLFPKFYYKLIIKLILYLVFIKLKKLRYLKKKYNIMIYLRN